MPVFLLDEDISFPDPCMADESGLLAIGGDLSSERLLAAYSMGIFPWYSEGQPILWFSPDPRLVLYPHEFKSSRSLRKLLRSGKFDVRFDNDFETVIRRCADASRRFQKSTWITQEMILAYTKLHRKGFAHSVETYQNGRLVGGLYGVSLGGAFFGESMFYEVSNASKVALYYLVKKCLYLDFDFIDSQVPTDHMKRMGAREVARDDFIRSLSTTLRKGTVKGFWNEVVDN